MFKKSYFVLFEYKENGYVHKGNTIVTLGVFKIPDLNEISDKLCAQLGSYPTIIQVNKI